MDDATPPFDPHGSRYDLSTYWGRVLDMYSITDSRTLLKTDDQVREAQQMLRDFDDGKIDGLTHREELWEAKRLKESAVHPDTGNILHRLLRFAAFPPVNVGICAAILAESTIASVPRTVAVHVLNQSYNAVVNYANGPVAKPTPPMQLAQSFGLAVGASVSLALGATVLAKRGSMGPLLRASVPFTAVSVAGVLNLVSMRRNDLEGLAVYDIENTMHGMSETAGKTAVAKCALTRVIWNVPIMLVPPLAMSVVSRHVKSPRLRSLAELGIISTLIMTAVPPAIAVFPRVETVPVGHLEPQFQNLTLKDGSPVTHLSYQKGI